MQLYGLYYLQNIIQVIQSRKMGWAGHVASWVRDAYKVLVEKLEGRRTLGRSRCRYEDNIKMDLQEMGWWGHGLD
jgi:hypothetical protein